MRDDRFEWDDRKAASNLRKHRVDFRHARAAFDDPDLIDELDEDEDEERFQLIGMADGRLLLSSIHCAATASASFRPEKRIKMSKTTTSVASDRRKKVAPRQGPTDKYGLTPEYWAHLDAMTEAEVMAAALADPDALPSTKTQRARMRRIAFAKYIRFKLGMSQATFAEAFGIPLGTLRDWEQHRREPDQAARAYLDVIAREPEAVRRALAQAGKGLAAAGESE